MIHEDGYFFDLGWVMNRIGMGILLGILVLGNWVTVGVRGSIHEYKNAAFTPQYQSFFFLGGNEGLYASRVINYSPKNSSDVANNPLDGKSFIRVKIGGSYLNSEAICCIPSLSKDGFCKLGEVIIRQDPDNPGWPKRLKASFAGTDEEARMALETVEINKTGMYYLYFMFCNPELRGTLINGKTVWHNPGGYLPGKMAPLMTFYAFMSLAYQVLGLFWFLRFVQYWKDVTQLHYHITAVIGLGMCEMALWYFEYSNLNAAGYGPMGITLWAVSFGAIKKTVSRLLLLVVAMGYGAMRPTLGGVKSKVFLLGVIYFMASEALELVEHLGNINDFSGKANFFWCFLWQMLDAFFIIWIFSSLSKTLEKLHTIILF